MYSSFVACLHVSPRVRYPSRVRYPLRYPLRLVDLIHLPRGWIEILVLFRILV